MSFELRHAARQLDGVRVSLAGFAVVAFVVEAEFSNDATVERVLTEKEFPTLEQLRRAGVTASDCKAGDFDLSALRLAGYSFSEANVAYPLRACRLAGYKLNLREHPLTLVECERAGFSWSEIANAGFPEAEFECAPSIGP